MTGNIIYFNFQIHLLLLLGIQIKQIGYNVKSNHKTNKKLL